MNNSRNLAAASYAGFIIIIYATCYIGLTLHLTASNIYVQRGCHIIGVQQKCVQSTPYLEEYKCISCSGRVSLLMGNIFKVNVGNWSPLLLLKSSIIVCNSSFLQSFALSKTGMHLSREILVLLL